MKELKSWVGDQIIFQVSEGQVMWERLPFIHDLRAEARPEVSGRHISAQCNSLYFRDCAAALPERFLTGCNICLIVFSNIKFLVI